MAGRDDKKVKAFLGDDIWQLLSGSVYNGELDAHKMWDIAFKLHEEVGGSPLKGMSAGMKKILTGSSFLRFSQIDISSVGTL